jgi:hypothetical protein
MELREPNDLTDISFDEFVSLIFDRGTPPEEGKLDASFYDVGVEFDAKKMSSIMLAVDHSTVWPIIAQNPSSSCCFVKRETRNSGR